MYPKPNRSSFIYLTKSEASLPSSFHLASTMRPAASGRVHVWSHVRTFACTYLTYPPRNLSSIPVHSIPYVRPHTLLLSELPHLGIHLLIDRPVRHARDALFACYLIDACADVSACVCVCVRVCVRVWGGDVWPDAGRTRGMKWDFVFCR